MFATPNGDLVFVNTLGRRHYTNYHSLTILSKEGKLKKRLFERNNEKGGEYSLNGFQGSLYHLNGSLRYFEASSYLKDTLWEVNSDYKKIPKFTFLYGDNKRPLSEHTEENQNFELMIEYDDSRYLKESDLFIFLDVYHADERRLNRIFFNKVSNVTSSLLFTKENGVGFYNDIDGGLSFWPQGKVSDNEVFKLIYGYKLKEYVDEISKNGALDFEKSDELSELIENTSIDDNPILMIVKLKK